MRHHTHPVVIIAFRGTEFSVWKDILADVSRVQTSLSSHPGSGLDNGLWGSVHSGFLNAWLEVVEAGEAQLRALNQTAESNGQTLDVYVTGHSLGGALATLTMARLLEAKDQGSNLKLRALYTVGSPRVGDSIFARRFNALTSKHGVVSARIRNANDIVTFLPTVGYEHIDELSTLSDTNIEVGAQEPVIPGVSIPDHGSASYYERLKAHYRDGTRFKAHRACGP